MHEWALVDSIASAAQEEAARNGLKKVSSVVIVLGELQNIDAKASVEIFRDIRLLKKESLHGAKLVVKTEKAAFRCRACGKDFTMRTGRKMNHEQSEAVHFLPEMAHVFLQCPKCASRDFEITKGRGVYIGELRGNK
jgi:hydrogenase nickel incorporation protein HypA/HybF